MEQFGFRPGNSTTLSALRLVDHLTNEMDNFIVPINIYIDLSKAFNSLHHSIILNKLSHYRISSCSNELFRIVICRIDYNSLTLMFKCPQNCQYQLVSRRGRA